MESVQYMLGSCRIPGEKVDTFEISRTSRHAIIFSKGVYYRLDLYTVGANGKLSRLSRLELKKQLQAILAETANVTEVNAVAALTSDDRTEWAKNRRLLLQDPVNAATMKEIETAIFILVLGDYKPKDENELARYGFIGDGASRWFDKGLTLEVFKDTTMAAANMEHSGADATHFAIMWEHTLQEEEFGPDGDLLVYPGETVRPLTPPKRLEWQFTNEVKLAIKRTLKQYQATMDTVDLLIYHTKYGKRWMKQQRISPDGFLQMAIQLAYWRMHGEFTKTYEPASHRLFALGRTDNINPVSEFSIRWVHTMQDPDSPTDLKISQLQEAIGYQSRVRLEATAGYGSDRHLLGLVCSANELGMKTPAIFTDKAYNLPMKLSTSQVPTNIGNIGVPLVEESTVGGFAPVCHEGYGLLYDGVGDDLFNFNITSWKTCPETDSSKFASALDQSLDDMKLLLESRNKRGAAVIANGANKL
jgi:carnitine O-palmitoyltransferase 1